MSDAFAAVHMKEEKTGGHRMGYRMVSFEEDHSSNVVLSHRIRKPHIVEHELQTATVHLKMAELCGFF